MKNYKVGNKVFGTREEAIAYADFYFSKTGIILGVTETNRKVTHTYAV